MVQRLLSSVKHILLEACIITLFIPCRLAELYDYSSLKKDYYTHIYPSHKVKCSFMTVIGNYFLPF